MMRTFGNLSTRYTLLIHRKINGHLRIKTGKGHRSDLARLMPKASFCRAGAFSAAQGGRPSSSCVHGNRASSFSSDCSVGKSSSFKYTSSVFLPSETNRLYKSIVAEYLFPYSHANYSLSARLVSMHFPLLMPTFTRLLVDKSYHFLPSHGKPVDNLPQF